MVVGEDLGVVPDEMRHAMPEFGLYHYKVLLFEKQDGRFRRPDEFVRRALATATTHDMPTLRSFWEGRDIELRRRLQLYPSVEMADDVEREREHDRAALLAALRDQGLAPRRRGRHPHSRSPPNSRTPCTCIWRAPRRRWWRCRSMICWGWRMPVNVPGTHLEYPNWQRKLNADLEDMIGRADFERYFADINRARA